MNIAVHEPHPGNGYMSADQTYHTPSFGDEEFQIPPLSLTGGGNGNIYLTQQMNHQQSSCNQNLAVNSVAMMNNRPHHYSDSNQHGGQNPYISQVADDSREMISPQSVHLQMQPYDMQQYGNAPVQMQQHMEEPLHPQMQIMQHQQPHIHNMGPPQPPHSSPVGGHSPVFTTISQSQLSSQLGLQIGMPSGHQSSGSIGSSPPGSNQTSPGLETSEDSDDSAPLSQLMGGIKRPSPEPSDANGNGNKNIKKPKPQKKKKKRDPNEPQKPVSAYALFFRDTQAAIKGQNPNASFGEVSKIVASMWDSLDIEHKNVYKKRTEVAKKEYLKALAAYRASLVSRAAADQSDTIYGSSISSTTPPITHSSPSNSPPGQQLSPLQKKSPLLTSLMEGMHPVTTMAPPPQPSVVASQVWNMHDMNTNPIMVQNQVVAIHNNNLQPQMQPTQMVSPPGNRGPMSHGSPPPVAQHMQPMNHPTASPTYVANMSPTISNQGMSMTEGMMPTCLRNGCTNPAIDSPDWDREYCSSECVVSHCRDVFTAWVASRQAPNSYASVK